MGTDKRERQKHNRDLARAQRDKAKKVAKFRKRGIQAALLVAVVIGLAYLASDGNDSSPSTEASTTTETSDSSTTSLPVNDGTQCPPTTGKVTQYRSFAKYPPMCIDASKTYVATIKTSLGTVVAELDAKNAPKTVNNFVVLSRYHYYDGLTFHRIINDFMVQGGDPLGNGSGGPGYQFDDELPAAGAYKIGSLAMANAGPNTNGSQFFIVTGIQGTGLQPKYSLFGQVTDGLKVIDDMQRVETGQGDVPVEPVIIESISIAEK